MLITSDREREREREIDWLIIFLPVEVCNPTYKVIHTGKLQDKQPEFFNKKLAREENKR